MSPCPFLLQTKSERIHTQILLKKQNKQPTVQCYPDIRKIRTRCVCVCVCVCYTEITISFSRINRGMKQQTVVVLIKACSLR